LDDVMGAPAYFSACGLTRTLVDATVRALRGNDCADMTASRDWAGRVDDDVVYPPERMEDIDPAEVASWIADQYPARTYPGVVIGSRHGSAAYLAAAMGVPWLPTGFDLDVRWREGAATDGAAALRHGADAANRILDRNGGVLVRQVHDPVRMNDVAGCRISLYVRWRRLPERFLRFLDARLDRGAFVLLVRDVRAWPVLDAGNGFSFQVGSSATGLELATYPNGPDVSNLVRRTGAVATWPDGRYRRDGVEHGVDAGVESGVRGWAQERDAHVYSILYTGADTLSAAVADIYRDWLRGHGKAGHRLMVSAGRLVDPWHTIRAGVVPYWCEGSTRAAVGAAELWLAGSSPFATVEILPDPPGATWSQVAPMAQWAALAQFASRRGLVNQSVARAYPLRALAPRHATDALRSLPYDLPAPEPLSIAAAVDGLRSNAPSNGILVSYAVGD
jgi:hypothetical protein